MAMVKRIRWQVMMVTERDDDVNEMRRSSSQLYAMDIHIQNHHTVFVSLFLLFSISVL